jgi:hypothetical protein
VARLHLLSSPEDIELEAEIPPVVEAAPSLREQVRQSSADPFKETGVEGDRTLATRILDVMTYIAPITKISREEAYQKLLDQRKALDMQLEALEMEENELYDAAVRRAEEKQAAAMHRV